MPHDLTDVADNELMLLVIEKHKHHLCHDEQQYRQQVEVE